MPVGGAHRGVWKSSGGLGTSDTFDRANGALGSTNGGNILAWQAVKGTWSITANRPTTTDARDTNPVAVVDAASPDVDVSVAVSPSGGDALYFRVQDANNWLRLRVDNTTFSSTYSFQCAYTYSYSCDYTYSYTCYATNYCAQYSSFCNPSYAAAGPSNGCGEGSCYYNHQHASYTCYSTSSSTSCCPGSMTHNHYGGGTCTCVDGYSHTHYVSAASFNSTGSFVACGSYSYTCYATGTTTCYATSYKTCYATAYAAEPSTVLDRSVGGTVTTLATYPDDPTTLRAVAVGDQVTPMINGVAKAAVTESAHTAATRHGFGRGPSANNGTAIDNFNLSTS